MEKLQCIVKSISGCLSKKNDPFDYLTKNNTIPQEEIDKQRKENEDITNKMMRLDLKLIGIGFVCFGVALISNNIIVSGICACLTIILLPTGLIGIALESYSSQCMDNFYSEVEIYSMINSNKTKK
jgi:hypothetical protein